ncbi:MAG TPA: isoprenoid biosynthesis glyoxalase ElbB [Myxococcota bacterium]|nr:isoprenoid biosynthesis glyoxalase ElbB [Myxococcota bacterium]HQK50958.1 isoprenoid biosynthesis glyoxalase ElbB [Myxococcota bacterium]
MSQKRVAVILSGCGVFDGSEIHEATLSLLALDRRGASVIVAAPDIPQTRVHDHQQGQDVPGETRNVRTEAARIARGPVRAVEDLRVEQIDAVLIPGGYGAALNLSTLARAGAAMTLDPSLARFLEDARKARKALGALCIAPPILAKVFHDAGVRGVRLTIGNDPGTAGVIEALGQTHVPCPATSFVADPAHRVVTSPAYMLASGIGELWTGIDAAVAALLDLA